MTDNKERTIKDILNDEIERKLAENPPKVPTLEEFKAMAYERMEEKKAENTEAEADAEARTVVANTKTDKKRKLYIACGAVGFVIAVMICAFAINMFTTDVGADKNPKDEIVTEDGVIIEDGGWGSSEGEDNVFVVTDWKDVKGVKITYPKLLIPEYMPEGYEFEKLEIDQMETGGSICEYIFINRASDVIEIEIVIHKANLVSLDITNVTRILVCNKGDIYIQEENNKKATIQIDDGIIVSIWSNLADNEIIEITESLTN